MAKRKFNPIENIKLEHYAYFDPLTDRVFLVTNELHPTHKYYAKITKDQHGELTSTKVNFNDCIIDRVVNSDGTIEHKLITKQMFDEFSFKKNDLIWITEPINVNTEFTVTWNNENKQWKFSITDAGRSVLSGARYDNTLVVFVTLSTDLDFLIRTFYLRIHDILKAGEIIYDFESSIESQIDNLSVSTKKFFTYYGIKHD